MTRKRKLILYGFLAALVVLRGGDWLLSTVLLDKLDERQKKTADLEEKIAKRHKELARTRKLAKKLETWEAQSLPADLEVARSQYRAWLFELVKLAEVASPNVDSGVPSNRRGLFDSLPFSVKGRATLKQLTTFLYGFYRAGHLHRIQSLSLTPLGDTGLLEVSLAIEALALPGAERGGPTAPGESPMAGHQSPFSNRQSQNPLALASLSDYRPIIHRNLFGLGGAFDPISQTYLSAVTSTNGQQEAWFDLRVSSKIARLRKGDSLQVGAFDGTIVEIDQSDVVLESDGELWLMTVGDNLDQAFAVPQEF